MSFRRVFREHNGFDPDPVFMQLTHEVLSGHGMAYKNPNQRLTDRVEDGHFWHGKTAEPVKIKDVSKDLEGIGWRPDTQGHADMGTYHWKKFSHPETHLTTLRVNLSTHPSPADEATGEGEVYHSRAEVL